MGFHHRGISTSICSESWMPKGHRNRRSILNHHEPSWSIIHRDESQKNPRRIPEESRKNPIFQWKCYEIFLGGLSYQVLLLIIPAQVPSHRTRCVQSALPSAKRGWEPEMCRFHEVFGLFPVFRFKFHSVGDVSWYSRTIPAFFWDPPVVAAFSAVAATVGLGSATVGLFRSWVKHILCVVFEIWLIHHPANFLCKILEHVLQIDPFFITHFACLGNWCSDSTV